MRCIVSAFSNGSGTLKPRNGSGDVMVNYKAIHHHPKALTVGQEVYVELEANGQGQRIAHNVFLVN